MTYYEILEVSETASEEVIRMAYKALAKKYHPDVYQGNPKEAEEKMKQINIAFEVLSDEQKRKRYDDFLHGKESSFQEEGNHSKESNIKTNGFAYPSIKKSAWIIGILLIFNYIQAWHPYAESELYDYSGLLGLIDFCFVSLLMMQVPILVGTIKSNLSPKSINKLCLINSIVLFVISLSLSVTEITSGMLIGWISVVTYFFINKHILLQIKYHSPNKKKTLVIVLLVAVLLVTFVVGGVVIVKGKIAHKSNYDSTHYTDIVGQVYDLNDYGECMIVRTITCENEFTANFIFERMRNEGFREKDIIAIMNEHGANQGGGRGYLIQKGEYITEIDNWCFDAKREVGDIAIIENDYGYSICYISAIFRG